MYEFKIKGYDSQYVDIQLKPGQRVMAEPGAMAIMGGSCTMTTVIGSGKENEGMFGKFLGAGQRMMTGESLALVQLENTGSRTARVVLSAPYQGSIMALKPSEFGGSITCQKEGFVLQKISSNDTVFIHCGGSMIEQTLEANETILVDTGSVVAFEPSVKFDIRMVRGIKNLLLSNEGISLIELRGPGRVFCQSLPFDRVAAQVLSKLPPNVLKK